MPVSRAVSVTICRHPVIIEREQDTSQDAENARTDALFNSFQAASAWYKLTSGSSFLQRNISCGQWLEAQAWNTSRTSRTPSEPTRSSDAQRELTTGICRHCHSFVTSASTSLPFTLLGMETLAHSFESLALKGGTVSSSTPESKSPSHARCPNVAL